MSHVPKVPRREAGEAAQAALRADGPPDPPDGSLPRPERSGATVGAGRAGDTGARPDAASPPSTGAREPIFTLPFPVVAMVGIMTAIEVVRSLIPFPWDLDILVWFAFIPIRYTEAYTGLPGGIAADVWTFVTYALLHGSWMHLVTNAFWLVAFGTPVARRFGALRFWAFSAVAAAGGAAVHLAVHPGDVIPVVGASAAVAGMMSAAARFVFDAGGPLASLRRTADEGAYRRPARSLAATLTNRTVLVFIGLFLLMNIAIGIGGTIVAGQAIAWEAHLGGFAIGLLAFRLFDPVPYR